MKAIVAIAENWGIGKDSGLPWPKISEDFKWFKEYTLDRQIILGRKTFDSVGVLPRRFHLVITRALHEGKPFGKIITNEKGELVVVHTNLAGLAKENDGIVCGGAEIYKELIPFCDEICITHVKGIYDADTFFPFSWYEITKMFPKNEMVRELDGGHKIIKYTK